MRISFQSEPTGHLDLRHGKFAIGSRKLETPHFFPVMNVMTGPPTKPMPTMANGGLWKWLKRLTLLPDAQIPGAAHQPRINGFLTQTLHFIDYSITPRMLQRWLPPGEQDCIPHLLARDIARSIGATSAKKLLPFIFLDSGGYQLLSSQQIDLSRYGWKTTPKDILDVQLRVGGDFLATLDYPIHPLLKPAEAASRSQRSMSNAIKTLELVREKGIEDKILFLAVHGRNRREAHDYTRSLLRKVAKSKARNVPFGLAIGSLVPLNNSPRRLISAVSGVMHAFREAEGTFDTSTIPVHAFGVNSSVAPYLTLLGVDTYDGTSYVRGAQNLTYYTPNGFSPMKVHDLKKIECSCAGCTLMARGEVTIGKKTYHGLAGVKRICSKRTTGRSAYYSWKDGYADDKKIPPKTNAEKADPESLGTGVPRSYFYALLALHNLNSNHHQARRVLGATQDASVYRHLIEDAISSPKTMQIVQALSSLYPATRAELREWGLENLVKPRRAPSPRKLKGGGGSGKSGGRARVWIDPALGPEDFDILSTSYRLPKGKPVLVVPCSKTKPYSSSSTHRLVDRVLSSAGVSLDAFEKLSFSGNYGPVPRRFEELPNVLGYDYLLHESNTQRIEVISQRLRALLARDASRVPGVVAYVTQKPYRLAIQRAFEGFDNCTLLPDPLPSHTSSQFRSPSNLSHLVKTMSNFEQNGRSPIGARPGIPLLTTRT